jgi:hypothetical protein
VYIYFDKTRYVSNFVDNIEKETLKPITKAKSKEDKELQEWEVESTGGGLGAGEG